MENNMKILCAFLIVVIVILVVICFAKSKDLYVGGFNKPSYYSGYSYQSPYPASSYMFTQTPYYYNYPWQILNRPFRETRPWRKYGRQINWTQY